MNKIHFGTLAIAVSAFITITCSVHADPAKDFQSAKTPEQKYEIAYSTDLCTAGRPTHQEACHWFDMATIAVPEEFEHFVSSLNKAELDSVSKSVPLSISRLMKKPFLYMLKQSKDCTQDEFGEIVQDQGESWVKDHFEDVMFAASQEEFLSQPAYAGALAKLAVAKGLTSENQQLMIWKLKQIAAYDRSALDQDLHQSNGQTSKTLKISLSAKLKTKVKKLAKKQTIENYLYQIGKKYPDCFAIIDSGSANFTLKMKMGMKWDAK